MPCNDEPQNERRPPCWPPHPRTVNTENVQEIVARGQKLWDSIYEPHAEKLWNKLGSYHPDFIGEPLEFRRCLPSLPFLFWCWCTPYPPTSVPRRVRLAQPRLVTAVSACVFSLFLAQCAVIPGVCAYASVRLGPDFTFWGVVHGRRDP